MNTKSMCICSERQVLTDITNEYKGMVSSLESIDVGDFVELMRCSSCHQLYKVDAWDKYQTSYAIKVPSQNGWKAFDGESLIKKRMIENRGGLSNDSCMWSGCNEQRINKNAFCVHHLYSSGWRV